MEANLTSTPSWDTLLSVERRMKSNNTSDGKTVTCKGGNMPCFSFFDNLDSYGDTGTVAGNTTRAALVALQQAWSQAEVHAAAAMPGYSLCLGVIDGKMRLVMEKN